MFKKTIIFLIIFSPILWVLIIGYPISHNRRQYATDDFSGYVRALSGDNRIKGLDLIKLVGGRVKKLLF
ncbi:hypothetical protein A2313_00535 [Candidatus Roizmanbacteria bacterium RIFOXYB2_FULL_41_10]|uniref:Uncharacterized protein n=1 Tax=Candidatus Roizmanbacteria bacterium RIFOXYA1_FULL_41_12 TaxID=1802082 RepID=A0A1F7KAI6_9BACT|nr:MAG: hypothetical protein A2209_04185 [Candidatus Roizmanbacteria bacterium RIFOXYA1_FULL_41_12]OGK66867.1 MAG: hypothetical protein A2377_03140 [Candidatus Roizmanbacteria bacterium RIFOXYB1_FULL_41_27]OGK68877.1 MAG: hypothetical protein A2262_00630 [Candidatus Roizmanbacteria bacterium RIFOXYA2_FULL_41_8]OGK70759.1 MAG: hypothetical protein A2403_01565 [Candidatus Roizmanbacteria bacterium RIFOXYC1_FULL_41_16]OGK71449.1 MAG: hypothetical protein A2313_00535 [Candidatus Roizmanbacteria bac